MKLKIYPSHPSIVPGGNNYALGFLLDDKGTPNGTLK